jgi:hypothetical protein
MDRPYYLFSSFEVYCLLLPPPSLIPSRLGLLHGRGGDNHHSIQKLQYLQIERVSRPRRESTACIEVSCCYSSPPAMHPDGQSWGIMTKVHNAMTTFHRRQEMILLVLLPPIGSPPFTLTCYSSPFHSRSFRCAGDI